MNIINLDVMHTSDRSTMFLFQPQLNVQLVATKSALHFFDPTSLPVKCHIDEEEWVRIIQIIVGPCSRSPNAPGPSPLLIISIIAGVEAEG